MRKLLVLPVLLAATVLPVTTSPPAIAKGATSVTVSGPGIEDRSLSHTRRLDDVDVGSLAEVSGIYLIYGAAMATDDPGLTRAELGRQYVLTWYVGSTVMAVSHVYPFTSQGAWTHIPYEQGGWVRGGPDLERAMVQLGAVDGVSTSSTDVGSGPRTDVGSDSRTDVGSGPRTEVEPVETSSAVPVGGVAGLAGLLVLGGATAWWLRRRRTPQPG